MIHNKKNFELKSDPDNQGIFTNRTSLYCKKSNLLKRYTYVITFFSLIMYSRLICVNRDITT